MRLARHFRSDLLEALKEAAYVSSLNHLLPVPIRKAFAPHAECQHDLDLKYGGRFDQILISKHLKCLLRAIVNIKPALASGQAEECLYDAVVVWIRQ